jgi:hypothetical protein
MPKKVFLLKLLQIGALRPLMPVMLPMVAAKDNNLALHYLRVSACFSASARNIAAAFQYGSCVFLSGLLHYAVFPE